MEGIHSGNSLAVVTGEVGTGKTTLMHRLRRRLQQQGAPTAFIFYTHLDRSHLLDFILANFGVPTPSGEMIDAWKRSGKLASRAQPRGPNAGVAGGRGPGSPTQRIRRDPHATESGDSTKEASAGGVGGSNGTRGQTQAIPNAGVTATDHGPLQDDQAHIARKPRNMSGTGCRLAAQKTPRRSAMTPWMQFIFIHKEFPELSIFFANVRSSALTIAKFLRCPPT